MKQNPRAVIGEATKSVSIGLDVLDGTVETYRASVGDLELAEGEQPLLVAPKLLENLSD